MLADKLRCTDWEATNEAMEEAVARESYLDWLRDREKRARGARALVRIIRALYLYTMFTFDWGKVILEPM